MLGALELPRVHPDRYDAAGMIAYQRLLGQAQEGRFPGPPATADSHGQRANAVLGDRFHDRGHDFVESEQVKGGRVVVNDRRPAGWRLPAIRLAPCG